jgi:putative addiction module component (TIGR02574 family)
VAAVLPPVLHDSDFEAILGWSEIGADAMTKQQIEAEALKLPPHERARLAELLIASLDEEDEIARAWADEAERRYEELRSGAVQPIPAEEVFNKLRSRPR